MRHRDDGCAAGEHLAAECRAARVPDRVHAHQVEKAMKRVDQPRRHEVTKIKLYKEIFVSSCLRGKPRAVGFACCVAIAAALVVAEQLLVAADGPTTVDEVFARYRATTPGCTVGVAMNAKRVVIKGYGMADLEHDVPNGEETIFEAGSVSKQFTAAAVLLLAREGKLSLDDPVRKYVPELPDFPAPPGASTAGYGVAAPAAAGGGGLTIRHMLTHTSGLRDWGSVEDIAGWPRTSRVYTHAHVLDIVSRQQSLNFTPGTHWSYSNTGFNLAAIIVSRVSGKSFADFTRERLFAPLGMARTSWRDDYTRVVKGRAIAYSEG